MPSLAPRASALASLYRPGRHGTHGGAAGIRISERRGLAIVQVACFDAESVKRAEAASGLPLAAAANRSARLGETSVLWAGPRRWLVVAETAEDLAHGLAATLAGAAVVTDLSHARTVLLLSGPRVRDVLAKGSGVDFHARAFPVGHCALTGIAKITAHVHAADAAPSFEVMVYRGYGLAFWEWLGEAAAEYGYEVA
ncbi:MAG: sarcosine oxidase subunit gamma [Proteobacteria bacterium]|nr:sarcosine oxidase subunit gamma [Pseudomonadota bacterium]